MTGSATPSIAVVGSGYWGKNLVRNYHQLGALNLICDKSKSTLTAFHNQYTGIDTCVAFSEVLNREDIDGVVIATPAETHFHLAREALMAGKHVYVEKPLVLEEDEGRELIERAKEEKRTLMVGHLLQYHPVFVHLKEMAQSGELGRINYIYSNRLNLGKIRREENILWSFAPHDISMILSIAGEEPEAVYATGGNYLHQRIADVTTTHLKFPSGLQAHIFVSWLHPFKEQKLVVVGENKMAVFDDTKPWAEKLLLYPHKINWHGSEPVPVKGDAEKVDVLQDEPLKLECQHFLECIKTGVKPKTDGEEGLRVLEILNASQRSLDLESQKSAESNRKGIKRIDADKSFEDFVFIDKSAVIDQPVTLGEGTKIWHFSHILKNSTIGKNCIIGQNVVIGPDVTIGNGCKIQNNVSVYKGVTLEDNVFCGPSMVFTNVYNPRSAIPRKKEIKSTHVKSNVTIGANATIVCGHTIGAFAFIAAGAVVIDDVPDFGLVAGNPAQLKGWMCQCGVQLKGKKLICKACGSQYELEGQTLRLVS
jgi:UDP-2-acetamido-3-amino-2,3-dideoxy-glucuronate N-acetyltransferase